MVVRHFQHLGAATIKIQCNKSVSVTTQSQVLALPTPKRISIDENFPVTLLMTFPLISV